MRSKPKSQSKNATAAAPENPRVVELEAEVAALRGELDSLRANYNECLRINRIQLSRLLEYELKELK